MKRIVIPEREYYDSSKNEFVNVKRQVLDLEHSLISISKWESKWKKPFFNKEGKTTPEFLDYVRCMTLNTNVDPAAYTGLTRDQIEEISKYIDDTMTATWFNENNQKKGSGRGQVITSELIYYWMIAYNIPFECQKWHLNRLLTLVRICEIKNAPSKKMSKKDLFARNRSLNAARKRNLGTNG